MEAANSQGYKHFEFLHNMKIQFPKMLTSYLTVLSPSFQRGSLFKTLQICQEKLPYLFKKKTEPCLCLVLCTETSLKTVQNQRSIEIYLFVYLSQSLTTVPQMTTDHSNRQHKVKIVLSLIKCCIFIKISIFMFCKFQITTNIHLCRLLNCSWNI